MAISVHYSNECLTKWAKWKFDRIWCKHFPIKNSMHLNKTHRLCRMYTMHTSSWCMDKWLSVIISFCSLHVRIVQQHKNCSGSFIFHMKKWHFAIRCEIKTTEKLSNWWKSHCVNLCCFVVLEILYRVNANADSYFSLSTVVFFRFFFLFHSLLSPVGSSSIFKNPTENRQSHTKNSSEWKMCNSLLLIWKLLMTMIRQ